MRAKLTPLQEALNQLVGQLGGLVCLVLMTIIVNAYLNGDDDPRTNGHQVVELLLLGVSFAVSSILEGSPWSWPYICRSGPPVDFIGCFSMSDFQVAVPTKNSLIFAS